MKFVEYHSGVPGGDSPFALNPAQEQHELQAALARVERENRGSYFEQVPNEYKSHVYEIAVDSYPDFRREYRTQQEFVEAFAQNWISKYYAFDGIARAAGLQVFDPKEVGDPDKRIWSLLTMSSSYVMVGTGAFKSAQGASGSYEKIPLRTHALRNRSVSQGVWLEGIPSVGNPAFFRGNMVEYTSPLIAVYSAIDTRSSELVTARMQNLGGSVTRTFEKINRQLQLPG